ncbi:MAG: hypothetical protein ABI995_16765, partial [Acidobacteriota bacterium]
MELNSLGGVVRKCRIDFGVEIEIDTSEIRSLAKTFSRTHCAVGKIFYPDKDGKLDPSDFGYLVYLKSSVTGDEPSDVLQYKAEHPAFPHESTGDQFFSESQFESYRALGQHVVERAFRPVRKALRTRPTTHLPYPQRVDLPTVMVEMLKAWTATSPFTEGNFAHHAEQLNDIWNTIREDKDLAYLGPQLFPRAGLIAVDPPATAAGLNRSKYFCQSILQLMENVYLDLRLETELEHPDNHGWMELFSDWARSRILQDTFTASQKIYGVRFQSFWERELPIVDADTEERSPSHS